MLGRVTPGLFTVLYLVLYFCGTPICCVTGRTGKDWNPVAAAAAAASRKAGRFQTESRLIFPATLRPFPEICGFVQLFFFGREFPEGAFQKCHTSEYLWRESSPVPLNWRRHISVNVNVNVN